jgi:hypothetical protein
MKQSQRTCFENNYRTAVALNNMGVELLVKGCFRQAYDTLKDAIAAMKETHIVSDTIERKRPSSGFIDGSNSVSMESFLSEAVKRVCAPCIIQTNCNIHFDAISDKNHAQAIAKISDVFISGKTRCDHDKNFLYRPVKIDVNESIADLRSDLHLDFESGVVLFNFAIVHLCLARTGREFKRAHFFARNALQLLCCANDVVAKECMDAAVSTTLIFSDPIHQYCQVLLTAMILDNVVQLCWTLGMTKHAEEAAQRLAALEAAASEQEEHMQFIMMSVDFAAAAAA